MKGMELCEKYYRMIAAPAIISGCPEAMEHLAAGLVGEGSECFGFDDVLSRDHDFGPRVCIWLTDQADAQYGTRLREILADLPDTFEGCGGGLKTKEAAGRSGVMKISDFYRNYTGLPDGPSRWQEWITVPEEYLATCTNGRVFCDSEGKFTEIRERFLEYYPKDVWIKKIAACAALMAQSGQYNYGRCRKRNEPVAAFMALHEFVKNGMSMVYLLNRRYMPYYKWAHRGLKGMKILPEAEELFRELVSGMEGADAISTGADRSEQIEQICNLILQELVRQGLCRPGDNFLLAHTDEITGNIGDPVIRALPLMFG